ncbi:MAG: DUF429 domain-containing protein [Rhodoferax sp.]|nr:DUF429 domain-containing protein [Rhodoferax sp.]
MTLLLGCDFSSSPSRRKQIVLATGTLQGERVVLAGIERLASLDAFGDWLMNQPGWTGAFDLPFGLPRELAQSLGWPMDWAACMDHYAGLSREQIRAQFAAFCDARPAGHKFAHRATDLPAQSSPSMKWVNPPVAFMLHAGIPRLRASGAYLPGLHPAPGHSDPLPSKVALEAYPALLAREFVASRSYKNDTVSKQTPERLIARMDIVHGLEIGATRLGLRLKLSHAQRDALVQDASGDVLDAVLCLVQAAWAQQRFGQGDLRYGLPAEVDPLEGWIVTA